ncbi:hypothetical protein AFLA70_493g000631 [Aspergillus flavus AF70]|nr:hypothetical protein AFLA70_493g000631 [Aspergillus flavus AF70]
MKRQLAPKAPLGLVGTDSSQQGRVQKRIGPSCDTCRTKRTKCDTLRPVCSSCQTLQLQCGYSGYDRRTKEQWNARIVALEQRNRYLERLVQRLSCNNSPEAVHKTLELEQIPSQQQTRPTLQAPEGLAEIRDITQVFYNATATHPTLDNAKLASAFDAGARLTTLPQEQFAWTALSAFFRCAGSLFYIITPQEAESLLERVYCEGNGSKADVCELCAIAAIGCHYEANQVSDEVRTAFFYIATSELEGLAQTSTIQGMRVFICLSLSAMMDKTTNARLLLMSALNIARRIPKPDITRPSPAEYSLNEYRRVLQTVIFLEGWLSYSLGYLSDVHADEVELV